MTPVSSPEAMGEREGLLLGMWLLRAKHGKHSLSHNPEGLLPSVCYHVPRAHSDSVSLCQGPLGSQKSEMQSSEFPALFSPVLTLRPSHFKSVEWYTVGVGHALQNVTQPGSHSSTIIFSPPFWMRFLLSCLPPFSPPSCHMTQPVT